MTPTTRRRPLELSALRRELSDRDLAIISDIGDLRMLQSRQIQHLHFHTGTPLGNARSCNRVLRRLHQAGLLERLDRRVGGVRAGSAGFVYHLTRLGQRVIDVEGGSGTRNRRDVSVGFQDHCLAVADLYVQLVTSTRESAAELTVFEPEPVCWRRFTDHHNARLVLKPDAYASVALADNSEVEQVSFIEVDLATEHTPTLRRKLQRYIAAFEAGVEQPGGAAFANVVWSVPTPRRADQLRRVISELPPEHTTLFSVVITGSAAEMAVLTGGNDP